MSTLLRQEYRLIVTTLVHLSNNPTWSLSASLRAPIFTLKRLAAALKKSV
jgi:hypothetical protein